MTKSQIFSKAHSEARKMVRFVGNYMIAFSLALKCIYDSLPRTETEKKLLDMGMYVWAKGGHRRIYINNEFWKTIFGIEIKYYKTGNISSAYLNGEKISNSRAYKISPANPYFDCRTQSFVGAGNLDVLI